MRGERGTSYDYARWLSALNVVEIHLGESNWSYEWENHCDNFTVESVDQRGLLSCDGFPFVTSLEHLPEARGHFA